MESPHFIVYLVVCLLVGYAGRNRKLGAVGYFLLSILLTPLIGASIVIASGLKKPPTSGAS